MSIHQVPTVIVDAIVSRAQGALPSSTFVAGASSGGNTPVTVTPDLTAGQATTLNDWIVQARSGFAVSAADVDLLRTFLGLTAPTNAQSLAAIKAIIRAMYAVIKDS